MGSSAPLIGILGGTFDPIHYGHLGFAAEVAQALDLAELRLLPAGIPPHRPPPIASAYHRVRMCELAIVEFPGLSVDGREARRPTPSYTVLTLTEIRAEVKEAPICFLLGADAFLKLSSWYRWHELFALTHLIIVDRPEQPLSVDLAPELKPYWAERRVADPRLLATERAGYIYRHSITPRPIAGVAVRALLRQGREPRDLIPPAVLAYIRAHRLYQ